MPSLNWKLAAAILVSRVRSVDIKQSIEQGLKSFCHIPILEADTLFEGRRAKRYRVETINWAYARDHTPERKILGASDPKHHEEGSCDPLPGGQRSTPRVDGKPLCGGGGIELVAGGAGRRTVTTNGSDPG